MSRWDRRRRGGKCDTFAEARGTDVALRHASGVELSMTVSAVNAAGESAQSDPVNGTPG